MADLVGWLAAALTILTFSMRSMAALRLAAIGANLGFIAYGFMAGLAPVLVLHLLLLPCNVLRLVQLRRMGDCCPARPAHTAAVEGRCPGGPAMKRSMRQCRLVARAVGFALAATIALVPVSAGGGQTGPLQAAPDATSEARVVLQAERCSAVILDCREIEIATPFFPVVEDCRNFLRGFWAHAALVGGGGATGSDRLVLRCRYDPGIARTSDHGEK